MHHIGTVQIKTERLILRRFLPTDVEAMFYTWANDPRVTKYLTWSPHTSVEQTRDIINEWCVRYEEETTYKWLIEYAGAPIGCIDVVRQNERNDSAELGYCIGFDFWGRGFMTEAVMAVLEVLFDQVDYHRVVIRHVAENVASGHVAKKCGFRHEGVERQAHKTENGNYLDIAYKSLLREEWDAMCK